MSKAFVNGCERVVWIVSKSESFRKVVDEKVTGDLHAIAAHTDSLSRVDAFRRILASHLSTVTLYAPNHADIVYFGKTANNRKEFLFLSKLLNEHAVKHTQLMFLDDISSSKIISDAYQFLIDEISKEASCFAAGEDVSGAHLWQILQYAATYLNIRATYDIAPHSVPSLAVVANDHSPSQVAFKAAMEALGVPVIYIQHAEVSTSFPPLDYFLSILRNEISLENYARAGRINGNVFILSRNPLGTHFSEVPNAMLAQSTQAVVGIYPTSRFDNKVVSAAAEALSKNRHVNDFFVKLHPNSRTKLDDHERLKLRVRADIPVNQHIALVGNSSVATDLLAQGIPVFQLFELDQIQPDYYGFVASGITPKTSFADIGDGRFWSNAFYSSEWLSRCAKFDPSIAGHQAEERRAVANAIEEQIAKRRSAVPSAVKQQALTLKPSTRTKINRAVAKVIEPVTRKLAMRFPREMNRLALIMSDAVLIQSRSSRSPAASAKVRRTKAERIGARTSLATLMDEASDRLALAEALLGTATNANVIIDLVRWFNTSWADRRPQAFDLVRSVAMNPADERDPWLRLIAHEIMAIPLSAQAASILIDEIDQIDNPIVRKIYEGAAMRVFIRNGHLEELFRLIHHSPVHTLTALGGNLKMQVAKQLFDDSRHVSDEDKTEFLGSLSEFERVKLDASGLSGTASNMNHLSLEERFITLTHPQLSREFSESLVPAYDAMRSRMSYMDVRTDSGQRSSLVSTIADAIANQRPFSLIRMGDGEAYLVPDSIGPFTMLDRQMRERHWWNCELANDISRDLRRKGLTALCSADIVGVPSIHRFFRDYTERSQELYLSTANRGIATSVLGAASLLPETVLLTEDRVHHLIFERDLLLGLLSAANRVVTVSSIRAEVLQEKIGSFCRSLKVVEIPTHAKTKHNPAFVSWDEPLPLVTGKIEAHLRTVIRPGDLVLVSAGIAGKSLIGTAKEMGAIGLDLGGQLEPLVEVPGGGIF